MISVILLIFTLLLIAIGGFCGFRRGILKEGVRTILWMVLFAGSCLFIPQVADKLPLLVAEKFNLTVVDVEQLVSTFLNKVDLLKRETYLILPLAGFVRSFIIPFVAIGCFWVSGFISWILYLIVSLFLRKKTEPQKVASKLAGLVLGFVMALISGAVTVYPVAAVSGAVQEGDSDQALCEEFEIVNTVSNAYEGSAVKMMYQFTGTEFLGETLHNAVTSMVLAEETHNIWKELPRLINLFSEGWQVYSTVTKSTENTLQENTQQLLDAFFSMNFISEDNKVMLLKRMKSMAGSSGDDGMVRTLLNWLEVQNKEQIVNDVATYANVYDILRQEGFLDAILNGTDMPELSEETGSAVVTALYDLSNADTVVPEFINMIYAAVISGSEKQLVRTENLVWNNETKEDISEVVSAICKVSTVTEHADSMSFEEKKMILEAIKNLKNNETVGNENYAALLKIIMGMM